MTNEKRLIDANELLELYNMGEELEEYADVLSVPIPVIRQNINDMPTVDAVEVVHGRWELYGENSTGNIYLCSVCKFPHNPNRRDIELVRVVEKPPYCPNCGAKMDGERRNDK